MVVGVGFEPTYATRADLQSAAFNHSATPPGTLFSQDKEILAKNKWFCELRKLNKFVNQEVHNMAKKFNK